MNKRIANKKAKKATPRARYIFSSVTIKIFFISSRTNFNNSYYYNLHKKFKKNLFSVWVFSFFWYIINSSGRGDEDYDSNFRKI